MTTRGFAGRLRVDRPHVGRVGLRRFPRHTFGKYTEGGVFAASLTGGVPGQREASSSGWGHIDPETRGRRYDAGWVI